VFLLVPAHPGSPRQKAVKRLLMLLLSNTSPICWEAANGSIVLNFGIAGDIADIMTLIKFHVISSGFIECDNPPLPQCKHYRATM